MLDWRPFNDVFKYSRQWWPVNLLTAGDSDGASISKPFATNNVMGSKMPLTMTGPWSWRECSISELNKLRGLRGNSRP